MRESEAICNCPASFALASIGVRGNQIPDLNLVTKAPASASQEKGSEPVPTAAILWKPLRRSRGIIMPGLYKTLPQRSAASCRSGAPVNSNLLPTCPHGVSLARDRGSLEHLQVGGSLLSGTDVRWGWWRGEGGGQGSPLCFAEGVGEVSAPPPPLVSRCGWVAAPPWCWVCC